MIKMFIARCAENKMKTNNKPTIKYLNSIFSSINGKLYYRISRLSKGSIKKALHTKDTQGRIRVVIGKRSFMAHHIIWAIHYKKWPKNQLDHINHIRDDNRIDNLREATVQENCKNRALNKRNKTGN